LMLNRKKNVNTLKQSTILNNTNRSTILNRRGEYFNLNWMSGKVSFGSTSDLIDLTLKNSDRASITRWLKDERGVALSIWDPNMIEELGDNTFRLKLMTLQFVTIQLAPSVDVKMFNENNQFILESVGFDPNVQILPGIGLSAEQLGIQIYVVGELGVSDNGKGLTGRLGFVSSGDLPLPLKILPEPLLKQATNAINREVSNFALRSFKEGAAKEFERFRKNELASQ